MGFSMNKTGIKLGIKPYEVQKYSEKKNDEIVVHAVYHDTVEYRDNLYKLPPGNITEGDRIRIERYDDQLLFYHATTNDLLCKHKLITGKGNIITLPIEVKKEATIEELLINGYKDHDVAIKFLKRMREQKTRYVYPQCRKIGSIKKYYATRVIVKGMAYYLSVDTCTAFELRSWIIIEMGDSLAKKFLPTHTLRHYKERAEVIRKELKENGRF